jgi:hypothetical protein
MRANYPCFSATSEKEFILQAMDTFHFQFEHTMPYREFVSGLVKKPEMLSHYREVPFLPVELFRNREIIALPGNPQVTFASSGTTGGDPGKHFVADTDLYRASILNGFNHFYGDIRDYTILALTPAPDENPSSSLVFMIDTWMKAGKNPDSGFFLNDFGELSKRLKRRQHKGGKTILIGLTFALVDFSSRFPGSYPGFIVMETGGMKGKRREMIREELHGVLSQAFGVDRIHSEYSMTELLSQAFSAGQGRFRTPPWMKVLIRDADDPLCWAENGHTGGINIIDLANRNSCSFIATQDLGRMHEDGTFEVLGRFDHSDVRGCNLMAQ